MEVITEIINTYGTQVYLSFISLIVTLFLMTSLKNFVGDFIFYLSARFSDIGFGQKIYIKDKIFTVTKITFKYIIVKDADVTMRIPLKKYMSGTIIYPRVE